MAELEALSPPLKERLTRLGTAEDVVAVPGIATHQALEDTIARLRGVLNGADPAPRTVLIHPDGALPERAEANGQPALLPFPLTPVNRLPGPGESVMEVYRAVFLASSGLGARACVVLGSDPNTLAPEAIRCLIQPILEQQFDLVAPCYLRRRFETLLNSSVIAPLSRALYA